MFVAVMNVEGNRVAKFAEFDTEEQAAAHVANHVEAWPAAFVVEAPDAPIVEWWVEGRTVTLVPVPPPVPVRVSARQFRLQLRASGLLATVQAWVASQSGYVQDSFEYSDSFVRTEPMMQAGFAELGFSESQIDAFFVAAAAL